MDQDRPLISIIIPCYNYALYLPESIGSIVDQTYSNWECIVIDDGSTDNSKEVVERICAQDKRVKYVLQSNLGPTVARNHGVRLAKGEFIQFLDADDIISPVKLLKSIEALVAHDVKVVCCNYSQFNTSTSSIFGPFSNLEKYDFTFQNIARYWNAGFTIPIHCFFFKHEVIKAHRFPIGLTAQEDWVMWLQIYQQNPKTYFLSETLAFYRSNPASRTQTGGFFNETLEAIHYLKGEGKAYTYRGVYEYLSGHFPEAHQDLHHGSLLPQ